MSLRLVNHDGDVVYEIEDDRVFDMLWDGRLNVGTRKAFARHLGKDFYKVMEEVSLAYAKNKHAEFMKELDA